MTTLRRHLTVKKFAADKEAMYITPPQQPLLPSLQSSPLLAVSSQGAAQDNTNLQEGESSENAGPPISPDIACELCHIVEEPERMLICNGCQKGFHSDCLEPPVKNIPVGQWFCDLCDDPFYSKNADTTHRTLNITLDDPVLHYIITEGHSNDDYSKQQKQRIRRRAGNYLMDDGQLFC